MPDQTKITIAQFDKALHDRSAFSCGIQRIDRWLQSSVSEQIKKNRLRLWCATGQEGALVGFYGLNAHSIRPDDAGALAARAERHEIPVLYLPCIAISEEYQGKGIGLALMGHAIKTAVDVSKKVAASAIILDVHKDDQYDRRTAFYTRLGFLPLGGEKEERMYLPMKVAEASRLKAEETGLIDIPD